MVKRQKHQNDGCDINKLNCAKLAPQKIRKKLRSNSRVRLTAQQRIKMINKVMDQQNQLSRVKRQNYHKKQMKKSAINEGVTYGNPLKGQKHKLISKNYEKDLVVAQFLKDFLKEFVDKFKINSIQNKIKGYEVLDIEKQTSKVRQNIETFWIQNKNLKKDMMEHFIYVCLGFSCGISLNFKDQIQKIMIQLIQGSNYDFIKQKQFSFFNFINEKQSNVRKPSKERHQKVLLNYLNIVKKTLIKYYYISSYQNSKAC